MTPKSTEWVGMVSVLSLSLVLASAAALTSSRVSMLLKLSPAISFWAVKLLKLTSASWFTVDKSLKDGKCLVTNSILFCSLHAQQCSSFSQSSESDEGDNLAVIVGLISTSFDDSQEEVKENFGKAFQWWGVLKTKNFIRNNPSSVFSFCMLFYGNSKESITLMNRL